jgi:hypothetical protein
LTADTDVLDEHHLRSEARSCAYSTPIADLTPGARAVVFGRIKSVVYTPRQHVPTLHAELIDGTGSVTLVWLGRRRIPGIEPGRTLEAQGCVAEAEGGLVIFNPRYDLWV